MNRQSKNAQRIAEALAEHPQGRGACTTRRCSRSPSRSASATSSARYPGAVFAFEVKGGKAGGLRLPAPPAHRPQRRQPGRRRDAGLPPRHHHPLRAEPRRSSSAHGISEALVRISIGRRGLAGPADRLPGGAGRLVSGRPSEVADSLAAVRAAFDPDRFRRDGQAIVDLLADHLARAQAGAPLPVLPWLAPDASVDHWGAALARSGAGAGLELPALLAEVVERSNHLHHPGYVGHQVTPPLPAAALCDLVGSLLNNGSAVYEMGPVTTAMRAAGDREAGGAAGHAGGGRRGVHLGRLGRQPDRAAGGPPGAGGRSTCGGDGQRRRARRWRCSARPRRTTRSAARCRSWAGGAGAPGRCRWTTASAWTRAQLPGAQRAAEAAGTRR